MNTDLELAYLGVEVSDADAFGHFLANVVGLLPGEPTSDGATTWRNDDRVHRVLVSEGPANDAAFVGFEASSPEAFERCVERIRAQCGADARDIGSHRLLGRACGWFVLE